MKHKWKQKVTLLQRDGLDDDEEVVAVVVNDDGYSKRQRLEGLSELYLWVWKKLEEGA